MNLERPNTWIVKSPKFPDFLKATYTDNHYGEIWLFNNDLEALLSNSAFDQLYIELITKKLYGNIDAVKFILSDTKYESLLSDKRLTEKFEKIAHQQNGVKRLSTFYFAKMSDFGDCFIDTELLDTTWVFYTHKGDIDEKGGTTFFRPKSLPPIKNDSFDEKASLIWFMNKQTLFNRTLKDKFESAFLDSEKFSWLDYKKNKTKKWEAKLIKGNSADTNYRRENRAKNHYPTPLFYDENVDIVVLAALAEEVKPFKELVLKNKGTVLKTPLLGEEYTQILSNSGEYHKVLFTHLSDQGIVASALKTQFIISKFKPKYLIMVGVCGGFSSTGVQIGDVIIADQILYYDPGQEKSEGTVLEPKKQNAGTTLKTKSKTLIESLSKVIKVDYDGETKTCNLKDEAILASGSKLMLNPDYFKKHNISDRKLYGTEMEAAGFAIACENSKTEFIVTKSVMDFCEPKSRGDSDIETDEEKQKQKMEKEKSKEIAYLTSANFAYKLIKEL